MIIFLINYLFLIKYNFLDIVSYGLSICGRNKTKMLTATSDCRRNFEWPCSYDSSYSNLSGTRGIRGPGPILNNTDQCDQSDAISVRASPWDRWA